MNTLVAFTVLLLAGLASTASIKEDDLIITSQYFCNDLSIYTAKHDIVNMICPLNSLNFDDESSIESFEGSNIKLFFVEADVTDDVTEYKGLYVLKNREATKLLDNGRDFAASADDSTKIYFAATDGLYVYNSEENKAEKYGTLTDSFIGVAKSYNSSDYLYALTEDRVLYKVTEEGTQKEEVTDVKDAVQIVMDFKDNLFFRTINKHFYVKSVDGVKKIKGIPNSPSYVNIVRPPFAIEEGVPVVAGKKVFAVHPNGTSEYLNLVLQAKPTAAAVEATLLQYYAYNKQIYEYNILAIIMGAVEMEELSDFFSDQADEIKMMGSKPRKSFRAK